MVQAQEEKSIDRFGPAANTPQEMRSRKAVLRKEKLAARQALSPEERANKSAQITRRVLQLPFVQEAENVLCYASYREEVQTRELIRLLQERGARIFLPKVEKAAGAREMEFFQVLAGERLKEGYCHIPEPSGESRRFCPEEQAGGNTAVLLPGAVFDREGGRIGYGGGYYDRYLERLEAEGLPFHSAGLCFSCQLAERVPQEETDRRVNAVVTETESLLQL